MHVARKSETIPLRTEVAYEWDSNELWALIRTGNRSKTTDREWKIRFNCVDLATLRPGETAPEHVGHWKRYTCKLWELLARREKGSLRAARTTCRYTRTVNIRECRNVKVKDLKAWDFRQESVSHQALCTIYMGMGSAYDVGVSKWFSGMSKGLKCGSLTHKAWDLTGLGVPPPWAQA